jgi:hypothetical protein
VVTSVLKELNTSIFRVEVSEARVWIGSGLMQHKPWPLHPDIGHQYPGQKKSRHMDQIIRKAIVIELHASNINMEGWFLHEQFVEACYLVPEGMKEGFM